MVPHDHCKARTNTHIFLAASALLMASPGPPFAAAVDLPKIVVILTDDQGYADTSLNPHHAPEVSTTQNISTGRRGRKR